MSTLPNFLIIGSMKSGTTSLYQYLRTHPNIYMPKYKEPQFFSDDDIFAKGRQWYENLFKSGHKDQIKGEASTNYTKYPVYSGVPERIGDMLPNVKLIYIVRSPVNRMYSHYVHNYYYARETRDLKTALLEDPHYLNVSKYYMQIEQYRKVFPKEQLKVILLDDLQSNPDKVVKETFSFIGVDPGFKPHNLTVISHRTSEKKGRDNKVMRTIKKLPFYHDISSGLSSKTKARLNRFLKNKVPEPDKMSESLIRELEALVVDDTRQLSDYLSRKLDFWFNFEKL